MNWRSAIGASRSVARKRRLTVNLIVGALIALALVVSVASLAVATTSGFPDVPPLHPYHAAITDLASRGIISGYENGDFGPADPVMRQQFAKMVVVAGGYPVSEFDVCPFGDVDKSGPEGLYPDNYVAVCADRGITQGKTPARFAPYDFITRLQVVSMVVRTADDLHPGLLASPPDNWAPISESWGLDATHGINALRAEYNGLLDGLDLEALSPTGDMTRGEVAQVLHNLLVSLAAATSTTTTEVTTTSTTEPPSTTSSSTTSSSTTTTTLFLPTSTSCG